MHADKSWVIWLWLATGVAYGVEVPAGTEIFLRLNGKVSSATAKVGDRVEALVIAPVRVKGDCLVPARTVARGVVLDVKASAAPEDRALLNLVFNELEIGGSGVKMEARISAVDNARETVDENGAIHGIVGSESLSARLDAGISRVTGRFGKLGGLLESVKGAVLEETDSNISYGPEVEFSLVLEKALDLKAAAGDGMPEAKTIAGLSELKTMAVKQPFQTMAQKPSKPSDMTNLMFVGSEEQLTKAFTAAGWSSAAALNTEAKFETFKAIAESRGYSEAPVSVLLLEDHPPDVVFEKQNNTFSARHHLRIWRRPATFRGQTVWVCAATHDIGIDFSAENRTFIHKIDSQIDREREKVINDLRLTGLVRGVAWVDRPAVPRESANATGDKLVTDGRIGVVVF